MAGHSHWAGIKYKKGREDKQKSKIFSKISKEIIVAAKLGDKDPDMNYINDGINKIKKTNTCLYQRKLFIFFTMLELHYCWFLLQY